MSRRRTWKKPAHAPYDVSINDSRECPWLIVGLPIRLRSFMPGYGRLHQAHDMAYTRLTLGLRFCVVLELQSQLALPATEFCFGL